MAGTVARVQSATYSAVETCTIYKSVCLNYTSLANGKLQLSDRMDGWMDGYTFPLTIYGIVVVVVIEVFAPRSFIATPDAISLDVTRHHFQMISFCTFRFIIFLFDSSFKNEFL